MCESTVVIEKDGNRVLLMEDVARVDIEGDHIKLTGILGETKETEGRITEINLMAHTIVIVEG